MKPARWCVITGNAAELQADALICPANVFLTLSGGIGGELLLRFGHGIQAELQHYLTCSARKHVPQSHIVETSGGGSGYSRVFHAVAVDGLYQSSRELVHTLAKSCLERCDSTFCESVVMGALATGYGRLSMEDFAAAISPLREQPFQCLREVRVCVRDERDHAKLAIRFEAVE